MNPLQREMEGEVQRALNAVAAGRLIVGAKLKACACGKPECLAFRRKHNFGEATVRITNSRNWPEPRQRRHFGAIGLAPAAIEEKIVAVAARKDVRIAVWHYYSEDRQRRSKGWVIGDFTRNARQLALGRNREANTPLPNRAIRSNADGDGGEDSPNYVHHPEFVPLDAGAAGAAAPVATDASAAEAARAARTERLQARGSDQPEQLRRTPEKPLQRNPAALKLSPDDKRRGDQRVDWWGLTSTGQIRLLLDTITDHYTAAVEHGGCPGRKSEERWANGKPRYSAQARITWRPSWDSTHATCLCIQGECSCCGMTFRWDSQPRSEATGNFLGNDMIATAIAASPVSVTHGRYFLSLLQLQPPAAATLRTVIYQTVAPALAEMWADEQQEMFQKMRFDAEGDGRTVICEFDMSHSCVRSAEHSTASVTDAETGLILWFIVLSQGEAATREAIACMESLKFFVGEGVDTGAYVIDDNRQTRRMIEDFQRSCAGSDAERKGVRQGPPGCLALEEER